MADVISDYQKWKQQGENLKIQAKQAMETRFRELLTEAASLADEYRIDFGVPLKPPSNITAFRYKASGRPKTKKPNTTPRPEKAHAKPEVQEPSPKIARLQKRLLTAKKRLDDAKTAGAPTRPLEDRIYEIEDELRLASQSA